MPKRFNPYSGKAGRLNQRSGSIVTAEKEKFFNDDGDFNADSKKDLIHAHQTLATYGKRGQIDMDAYHRQKFETEEGMMQLFAEAMSDPTGHAFTVLGQSYGDTLYETMGRQGFARNCALVKQQSTGDLRFRVRKHDVEGWMVTSNSNIAPSVIRNHFIYPPEVTFTFSVEIPEVEAARADADLFTEKYNEGLEQIMRSEDILFKQLCDATVNIANPLVYFNTFTPAVFSTLKEYVERSGGGMAQTAVLSIDIWTDMFAGTDFANWYEPIAKRELTLEGKLGSFAGVQFITDGYRYETLKVLEPGEIYFFGPDVTVGGIIERAPLVVKSTDQSVNSKAARGWFGFQIEGMAALNRSIAKGQRF